jgi:hypothetical protein
VRYYTYYIRVCKHNENSFNKKHLDNDLIPGASSRGGEKQGSRTLFFSSNFFYLYTYITLGKYINVNTYMKVIIKGYRNATVVYTVSLVSVHEMHMYAGMNTLFKIIYYILKYFLLCTNFRVFININKNIY